MVPIFSTMTFFYAEKWKTPIGQNIHQTNEKDQWTDLHDLKHEGLIDKWTMNEFRDELFMELGLPVPRDASSTRTAEAKLGMNRPIKITLFAEWKNVWKDLNALVNNAQQMKKYHNVLLDVIENMNNLAVAKQAYAFNSADAIVLATGDHMANAIFSPDGVRRL